MRGVSLLNKLLWDFDSESLGEMESELKSLLKTHQGIERLDAFVACCDRHMRPLYAQKFGCEAADLVPAGTMTIEGLTSDAIILCLAGFIDDPHREAIVRCHARGMSTTEAVYEVIDKDAVMSDLSTRVDMDTLVTDLVHRLAYLKPTSNRFPQKYIPIWNEERAKLREGLRQTDLPLTSIEEWIALLSREAVRLKERLTEGPYDEKTHQTLMDTLMKVYDRFYPDVGVGRRLSTLAFEMTDKTEMIVVLERLIVALKSGDENALDAVLNVIPEQTLIEIPIIVTDTSKEDIEEK